MILFPTSTVKLPPPLTAPETKAVMAALQGSEKEPAALFVGGCVRNALMNRPVEDIDIATIRTPKEAIEKLSAAGIRTIPTGIEHGTVTAVANGKPFEITTLRRDVSTDGRRAVVAFTKDWEEDAQRRDFTMNTLLADEKGNIYDPTGRGLSDLRAGRVAFVGEPAQRIAEDYLRILRFFRFHASYGKGPPDLPGLVACAAAAEKISTLSRERITQEFFKILALESPVDILQIMRENKILHDVFQAGHDVSVFNRLCSLQKQHKEPDVMARIVVLGGLKSSYLNILNRFFVFSREQSRMLGSLLTIGPGLKAVDEPAVKALIYRYGRSVAIQSVLLFCAQRNVAPDAFFARAKDWSAPAMPVTGDDVMKKGVPAGPKVGAILSAIENWWIQNNFSPGRDACMKKLDELMAGEKP